jgi:TetR/AcrR family transcriptional repressor of bet genes
MARPSNRDQRRQQIVDGLIVVMAKHGYEAASIAKVAEAAGLTSGLVHYHFNNKQEILLGLIERMAQQHLEGLARRLDEAGAHAEDRLAAFIDRHLALGADADLLACWIVLSAEAIRQPEVRRAFNSVLDRLTETLLEIINAGVEQGSFCCADTLAAASALVAAIQGYFVIAATGRRRIPKGSAAPSLKLMAAGLLHVPPAAPGGADAAE